MHVACAHGSKDCVAMLLARGADVNAKDNVIIHDILSMISVMAYW